MSAAVESGDEQWIETQRGSWQVSAGRWIKGLLQRNKNNGRPFPSFCNLSFSINLRVRIQITNLGWFWLNSSKHSN